MNDQLLKCQKAAGILLKQCATLLNVSQDDLAYALAGSLEKHDGVDTVRGYYRKVPRKFLVAGYKKFRKALEESVNKLSTQGFVFDMDVESVRSSWAQYGEELLNQFDKIHARAVNTYMNYMKATVESHRQKIEDLLSD